MIDFLSAWAEQIIIAVVIASIIEMIVPDNKNKKYVKMVIGIYILFNIISPIIGNEDEISLDRFSLESYAMADTQTEEVNQESMDERLQELYIEELENNIKTKVEEEGYSVQTCKVDAVLSGEESKQGINKIKLTVSKSEQDNTKEESSDIQSIDKIEINVGLNKYFEGEETENEEKKEAGNNKDVENLKNVLSSFYEIDADKISISIK